MIEPIVKCAAGLDVHQGSVMCTVLEERSTGAPQRQTRQYSTFPRRLQELGLWLKEQGVELKSGVPYSQSSPEIREIDKLMKSGKLSLLLVLGLALSLGLAASVWAQPMGKDMGPGPGMMNLTPEQAAKIFDLKEKMYADTAGLRKQGMVKHAELAALCKAEKPDQNAIQAKEKELKALTDQMQEKMAAFQLEAKKIAPDFDMGMGMGMGQGCGMGPGPGKGMGKCPGAGPPPPPAK